MDKCRQLTEVLHQVRRPKMYSKFKSQESWFAGSAVGGGGMCGGASASVRLWIWIKMYLEMQNT